MDTSLFRRGRRTTVLLALAGAVLALAVGMTLALATQSAQAKPRHTRPAHHHKVHHGAAKAAESTTAGESATETDGPNGPNDQSGAQSGPNDQSGGPDTPAESTSSESAGSPGGDPSGGANCVDNQGCQ